MINNFHKVTNNLYRGAAPSPKDVLWLKENFGINKIISLDELSGKKIERATKLLNIKHIMLPINGSKSSLLKFLHSDFRELFLEDGPVYVHCKYGADRTGLAIALVKCKYFEMNPEDAIKEAKSYGFGKRNDPKISLLYEKIIKSCNPEKDNNNADIVSNEREYKSDNRDSFLDEGHQGSFAPYLSVTRQNPMDAVYNYIVDQSPTRENYNQYKNPKKTEEKDVVPQVGIYNNDAGNSGQGFVLNPGGFIYD
jgi:hypothetical protein